MYTAVNGMAKSIPAIDYLSFYQSDFSIKNVSAIHFNSYLLFLVIFIGVFYIYSYGTLNITNLKNSTYLGNSMFSYLDEIEEEFGQTEDILTYITFFVYFIT